MNELHDMEISSASPKKRILFMRSLMMIYKQINGTETFILVFRPNQMVIFILDTQNQFF